MWPYPSRSVRLFVQNVPRGTSERALRRHFEAATGPGDVLDLFLRTFCATVHMRDEAAGERARRELHGRPFRDHRLAIHRFRGIKIFVGGLPEDTASEDLRPLFEGFGPVAECDVVKDYAFVHMDNEEDGKTAIEHLNGMEFKGSSIVVQRSVKDRKHFENSEQNSEQETGVEGDPFPYYGDQPLSSDQDYQSQSSAYRNGPESEDNSYSEDSRGRSRSAQSHSYGSKSYGSHNAVYENQDDSYSMQFSDSLSTRDRASVDAAYQHAPDRLASSDRETASRHSLYERVRLSPRRTSYNDHYRDKHAVSKRYTTRQADDSYGPPSEYVRSSSPHSSRDDFDRRGNGSSKRYTARSESASRHTARSGSSSRYSERSGSVSRYTERSGSSRYMERSGSVSHRRPYERSYLSPPHRSRENHRSYR